MSATITLPVEVVTDALDHLRRTRQFIDIVGGSILGALAELPAHSKIGTVTSGAKAAEDALQKAILASIRVSP